MRRAWLGLATLLALAGGSCNGNETGPVAGELAVRFATPSTDDRALVLRLVGPQTGVRSTPWQSYGVYQSSTTGDTTVIAVVAPQGSALGAGELVRFSVPDTRKAGSYTVTLSQVAGADYRLRDVRLYGVVVRKP